MTGTEQKKHVTGGGEEGIVITVGKYFDINMNSEKKTRWERDGTESDFFRKELFFYCVMEIGWDREKKKHSCVTVCHIP